MLLRVLFRADAECLVIAIFIVPFPPFIVFIAFYVPKNHYKEPP